MFDYTKLLDARSARRNTHAASISFLTESPPNEIDVITAGLLSSSSCSIDLDFRYNLATVF